MARSKRSNTPSTIENRRARFDYVIDETLEVGMALLGSEVKAIRAGNASLAEGYVAVGQNPPGLVLHGVNIGEYPPAGPLQHPPTRQRTLLAHKREILKLARRVEQKGVTVVPLKIYFKNGRAKLLIGVGTGRARHDKRTAIAERDVKRELQRAMSRKA